MAEELIAWLLSPECRALEGQALIAALIDRLRGAGLPLDRFNISIHTRHPEVWVENFKWDTSEGLSSSLRDSSLLQRATYLDSPVAELHTGVHEIRVGLPAGADRYPVTRELAAAGYSDYLCIALSTDPRSFISLATRQAGGFTQGELHALRALQPALSLRLSLASERAAMASLLRTYLGPNAAKHVLDGQFRRGQGRPLEAVIWSCDLRGFTTLVDTTEIGEVLRTLDAYFECVADPIAAHGGEVLKFIGDAVLAIFPRTSDDMHEPCAAALRAAQAGFEALEQLNASRAEQGQAPLQFGVALHRGVVTYGNIGAHGRLDFTVIGPAVNEVTRVEALCKVTGCRLLLTAAFAEACDTPERAGLCSLGAHTLRGVAEPVELFGVVEKS